MTYPGTISKTVTELMQEAADRGESLGIAYTELKKRRVAGEKDPAQTDSVKYACNKATERLDDEHPVDKEIEAQIESGIETPAPAKMATQRAAKNPPKQPPPKQPKKPFDIDPNTIPF